MVLVGLPGAGKSTWLARRGLPSLSSDEIRRLLMDNVTDQSINRRVFATVRHLLRLRLELRRPVTCIDATHLAPRERRPYIVLGDLYDARVDAVFFDVPLPVCRARNQARNRVVPDDVLERMAARLVAPATGEGFTQVEVIRS